MTNTGSLRDDWAILERTDMKKIGLFILSLLTTCIFMFVTELIGYKQPDPYDFVIINALVYIMYMIDLKND